MKTFKLLSIIAFLSLINACSNGPDGSEYLGTWVYHTRYSTTEMNITRVGESFLVEGTAYGDGIYIITKENYLLSTGSGIAITCKHTIKHIFPG